MTKSVACVCLVVLCVMSPPAWGQPVPSRLDGAWVINRDLSPVPEPPEEARERPRERPPMGGSGGGSPRGGFGGGPGGMFGRPRGPDDKEMRKMEVVRRRLQEAPDRLVIAIEAGHVTIVDGFGRSTRLRADGKKQERVTGDGEFTSKTRFDGDRLIVEEDFGGPKVITIYESLQTPEMRRLEVSIRVEGLKNPDGAPGRDRIVSPDRLVRIYDAEGKGAFSGGATSGGLAAR